MQKNKQSMQRHVCVSVLLDEPGDGVRFRVAWPSGSVVGKEQLCAVCQVCAWSRPVCMPDTALYAWPTPAVTYSQHVLYILCFARLTLSHRRTQRQQQQQVRPAASLPPCWWTPSPPARVRRAASRAYLPWQTPWA